MLLNLYSFITGRPIVWLKDHQGSLYRTYLRKTPFGLEAPVFWITGVGKKALNEDGTVSNSYIEEWKYESKQKTQ